MNSHVLTRLATSLPVALLVAMTTNVAAAPVKTPHVEAEIISRLAAVQPGQPIEVALRLKIIDHWHTYWQNPGDSGLPTKLAWTLPDGISAGPIEWPYPKRLPLGPLMNFGYEGEVLHLVKLQTPASLKVGGPITLKAKAEWLVCSDVCIPENAELSIDLPVVGSSPLPDNRWANAFKEAQFALPGKPPGWKADARIENGKAILTLVAPPGLKIDTSQLYFYPLREEIIANAGRQVLAKTADGVSLTIPMADPVNTTLQALDGVLVSITGWAGADTGKAVAISAPVVYGKPLVVASLTEAAPGPASSGDDLGLLVAMFFAFVGGLFLNLMPCVFPVLGIKVMGFVQHAQGDQRRLKFQGFAFLAGVVGSFWVLAGLLIVLRAGGASVGWGFQLQSPVFVTLLALLFLLMALNLSGVFEMGLRLQSATGGIQVKQNRGPVVDAFLSGVLATIIATPCTAPFMGAALGFTLSQSAFVSLLVFTAVAFGVAAPVVALSMFPGWLRRLPKPGAWMDGFKQFMAFPLYATVVWLVWVLGSQQGNDGAATVLSGMVVVAFAAWLYGRWQLDNPLRALITAVALFALGTAIAWPGPTAGLATQGTGQVASKEAWVPFSKEKVAELRGQGRAVFIDFTATWCITCQVNKRVALNDNDVVQRFSDLNVVRMKADWTVKDAAITEALAEFGRNGVPLYVFYPAGGGPKLLPEILTPAIVLSSLGNPATVSVAR